VNDLPWVDIDYNEFWIENRKYIQNDNFIKYNLYKRIDLWEYSVKEQLSIQNRVSKKGNSSFRQCNTING
jgi:hypothetical protein